MYGDGSGRRRLGLPSTSAGAWRAKKSRCLTLENAGTRKKRTVGQAPPHVDGAPRGTVSSGTPRRDASIPLHRRVRKRGERAAFNPLDCRRDERGRRGRVIRYPDTTRAQVVTSNLFFFLFFSIQANDTPI